MWVNQTPGFQVGPNGAVNLDQAAAPGTPYSVAQFPPGTVPPPPPVVAAPTVNPYAAPYIAQPWGSQAIQPQPAWGAPVVGQPAVVNPPIPPSYIHRTSVFGEALFMRWRNAEVAYALPIDGPVVPQLGNEVPIGPVAVVDPDYDIGFRLGLNVALNPGASITGQYTRIHTDETNSASVVAPNVLRSLVTHPLGGTPGFATDALDAAAQLDIDLDMIDVDFRTLWLGCECPTCAYALSVIAGAEFARLEQAFAASYTPVPGTTTVNTDIDFDGIGMRLGLQGERFYPGSGVFVYGSGISNFLFGEFDASYTQANTIAGTQATTSWSAGRIVPRLDLELGAGWMGPNRHLRLSAGYRVSAWFNVVTTDEWINAVQRSEFDDMSGTLTQDGLVGRAEWLF
jgi:hypothetical protein